MKYVRKIRSPSRTNQVVPCHSSTPKSLSKSSVIVYQGISQLMRFFSRSMSGLRCAGDGEHERRVTRIQMGDVRNLVGEHRAADAGVLGPAVHAGLEEGAVHDQLTPTVEQVEQTLLAFRPFELVFLLHREPRHPTPLGSERVAGLG